MSALGQKRTSRHFRSVSALPPIADIPGPPIAILARSSPAKKGGGANVNMGGVSVRGRDLPYLRFPRAIGALVLQATHSTLDQSVKGLSDVEQGAG
jgi:hypothetical protein